MNAQSEPRNEGQWKAFLRGVNTSWLRYPTLAVTLVLVAAMVIETRQLAEGILFAVESLAELFTMPL